MLGPGVTDTPDKFKLTAVLLALSSFTPVKLGNTPVKLGASLTAVTVTCTFTGVEDTAPRSSFATMVKAFSVPLSFAPGVQYKFVLALMVFLVSSVTSTATAEPKLVPIFNVPERISLMTKLVTVPSSSASLALPNKSAKVITTSVSSSVVTTDSLMAVKVGASFTAATLAVTWMAVPDNKVPSEALTVKAFNSPLASAAAFH